MKEHSQGGVSASAVGATLGGPLRRGSKGSHPASGISPADAAAPGDRRGPQWVTRIREYSCLSCNSSAWSATFCGRAPLPPLRACELCWSCSQGAHSATPFPFLAWLQVALIGFFCNFLGLQHNWIIVAQLER